MNKYLQTLLIVFCFSVASIEVNADDSVGVLPGEFSVSPSGAATYTIPIEVPPGINGMQPQLSINYSSQGGNGRIGLGMDLGGLSVISRCGQTKVQDGLVSGITFGDGDRYCLDGQRLVKVGQQLIGVREYGASGTIYRTEVNNHSKINSYYDISGDANYFIVQNKSGQTIQYGGVSNARILAAGKNKILYWAMNRVEDAHGNYMTITYDGVQDNSEFWPSRIDYTGSAGSSPYASVRFGYSSIQTNAIGYLRGSKIATSELLTSIKVYYGENLVSDYQISYDSSQTGGAQRYLVSEIRRYNAQGIYRAATEFTWQSTGNVELTENKDPIAPGAIDSGEKAHVFHADWNADGYTDMLYWNEIHGTNTWYLNDGAGNFVASGTNVNSGYINGDGGQLILGDWNADGLTDLMWYHGQSGGNRLIMNYGDPEGDGNLLLDVLTTPDGGYIPSSWITGLGGQFATGDFNADGYMDLFFSNVDGENNELLLNNGNLTFSKGSISLSGLKGGVITSGDFNADGVSDVFWYNSEYGHNKLLIMDGDPDGNGIVNISVLAGGDGHSYLPAGAIDGGQHASIQVADFNSDGYSDLFYYNASSGINHWYLNDGTMNFTKQGHYDADNNSVRPGNLDGHPERIYVKLGDWNSDGMMDFVFFRGHDGVNDWYYNDGNYGFTLIQSKIANGWINDPISGWGNLYFGDWDGDAITDVMYYHKGSGRNFWYTNDETQLEVVTEIENGFGHKTKVTYGSTAGFNHYTRQNTATFPEIDLHPAMPVVIQTDTGNGVGGWLSKYYHYVGMKVHLHGRGGLGFEKQIITSLLEGAYDQQLTTTYHQKFPFTGMVASVENKLLTNDVILSRIDNTYSGIDAGNRYLSYNDCITFAANDTPIFPYVSRSVTTTETMGNTIWPINTIQTTIDTQYDLYGNVTKVDQTTLGGGNSFSSTTQHVYHGSSNALFRGLVYETAVTQTTPYAPPFQPQTETRRTQFQYTPEGLVSYLTKEPGTSLAVTTSFTYNSVGQLLTKTINGSGIGPRTITHHYEGSGARRLSYRSNPLGHSENYDYQDGRFPWIATKVTSANGIITETQLNGFGEAYRTFAFAGTGSQQESRTDIEWYNGDSIPNAVYYTVLNRSGVPDVITYYDSLNRPLQTQTQSFANGVAKTLITRTEYNKWGLQFRVSEPYFAGGTPNYTETSYDGLLRPKTIITPDGSTSSVTYNGLTTTTTNALDQNSTVRKNALGQVVETIDHYSNSLKKQYDAFGNLVRTTDPDGNEVKIQYDIRGHKVKMDDPDQGIWTYSYYVDGSLKTQTDAKSQTTTMHYDALGRMTSRIEPEGTTTWVYDDSPNGIGKLSFVSNSDGFSESYAYNSLGQLTHTYRTMPGQSQMTTWRTFDNLGRASTINYPGGFRVRNHYHPSLGHLEKITDDTDGATLWEATGFTARGQLESFSQGGFLDTVREYDPATGYLEAQTVNQSGSWLAFTTYDWLPNGNLDTRDEFWRQDASQRITEFYHYDDLNRLVSFQTVVGWQHAGEHEADFVEIYYDALGNIKHKSDVGDYCYGSACNNGVTAGPHTATEIDGKTYNYDANGNMISGNGRFIQYTSFNKPKVITKDGNTSTIHYGSNRSRYKRVESGTVSSTIYYAGAYEKEIRDGTTIERVSVGGHTLLEKKDGLKETHYMIKDHLGSTVGMVRKSDGKAERMSFDPWGKRRQLTLPVEDILNVDYNTLLTYTTQRGFTGHEHLSGVGLIHMNGRVYDPTIARFLSADPFIQASDNLQSYNRYSYVINNPLSYTDPSGYFFKKLKKALSRLNRHRKSLNKEVLRAYTNVRQWNPVTREIDQALLRSKTLRQVGQVVAGVADAMTGGASGGMFSAAYSAHIAAISGGSPTDVFSALGEQMLPSFEFYGYNVGLTYSGDEFGASIGRGSWNVNYREDGDYSFSYTRSRNTYTYDKDGKFTYTYADDNKGYISIDSDGGYAIRYNDRDREIYDKIVRFDKKMFGAHVFGSASLTVSISPVLEYGSEQGFDYDDGLGVEAPWYNYTYRIKPDGRYKAKYKLPPRK